MSCQSLLPIPYLQFYNSPSLADFSAYNYKIVPNKKINFHYPFIIMDYEQINLALEDIAIVEAEDAEEHELADYSDDALRQPPYVSKQLLYINDLPDLARCVFIPTDTNNIQSTIDPNQKNDQNNIQPNTQENRHGNGQENSQSNQQIAHQEAHQQTNQTDKPPSNFNSAVSNALDANNYNATNTTNAVDRKGAQDTKDTKDTKDTLDLPDNNSKTNAKTSSEANNTDVNTNADSDDGRETDTIKSKDEELQEELNKDEAESKKEYKEKEAQLESYKQFLAAQQNEVDIDYQGIRIRIEANAMPSRMYFIMNMLSAIIASYGLVINSSAVVIGAMLVAMMLGPITGVALALIDNRTPFLRKSLLTVFAGGLTVIIIGFVVGLLHQDTPLTNEILSRTQPTSMDLMIALAGGTAGAYAMISPHLSVAVVGVAVATALVPPLAASGILFAHGEGSLGMGALLLAVTNIIAIQFTNALVLWFAGFRRLVAKDYKTSPVIAFFRRNSIPLILLVGIGGYLTYNFNLISKQQKFENEVKQLIDTYFEAKGNVLSTAQFVNRDDHQMIRAVIRGETQPSITDAKTIEERVDKLIDDDYSDYNPVRIQLRYLPVVVINSNPFKEDSLSQTDAKILSQNQ